MRLPNDRHEREVLYRNLVRECEISRDQRREHHRRMRTVYLNGDDRTEAALYNRILEFVDTSSAYIFDPEGTKFDVEVGAEYGDEFLVETEVAATHFQKLWAKHFARTVSLMVEYAHPFPSTIAKVFSNRGRVDVRMLDDPAHLGVWREDLPTLGDQEAMVHHFELDVPSFERLVAEIDPSVRAVLVSAAKEYATRPGGSMSTVLPPAQARLILSAVTPNAIGAAQAAPMVSMAQPISEAPVVRMAELWVWDDAQDDWQVVTMFRPTETMLWEIRNPQPGIDAFYQLCLFPTNGYLWGLSPIERLVGLQEWRTKRMRDIDALTELNLDPPRAFLGVSGINDEKAERLRSPGGIFTTAMMGGDIKSLAPPMPPDAWTLVDGIDRMFNRAGGLPPGADVGAETAGIRAGDQLEAMANLGSPRTRKRAMYVESFLNELGTAILRVMRRTGAYLVKPTGEKFQLSQLPGDLEATVAGHSASPLYAERMFERALLMHDRKAVDDETLVAMSGLPMQNRLRAKARRLQEAKAESAKEALAMKNREIDAKEITAQAKLRKV